MKLSARRGAGFLLVGMVGLPLKDEGAHPKTLERPWRLVDGHHWQVESPEEGEPAAQTDAREGTRGDCHQGMVAVSGKLKLGARLSVEEMQDETCSEWIDRKYHERCANFDRASWLVASESLPTRAVRFCIDRFEYPNSKGVFPVIDVSWRESEALCREGGKRLCTEEEWTFACEGDEATPYPTGYQRDSVACVIDRPWLPVDEAELSPREGRSALLEIDRVWQGEASGSHPACRSASGVYDTTGNVDEWTSSVEKGERPSILKGGYWGPVRARCRPSTRAHGEDYSYYQQGFRCCTDIH